MPAIKPIGVPDVLDMMLVGALVYGLLQLQKKIKRERVFAR